MREIFVATTLLVLVAGPVATAQTAGRPANPSSEKQGPWPAPVGHRQPRADQVPPENNLSNPDSNANREDAALDRKLKSICRGC
jgi:hypothetical protein